MSTKPIRAYHFVGDKLRNGKPIPPDGETLTFRGKPVLCEKGLHASEHPFDALQYAPGATLCLVELSGTIVRSDDKLCATKRKIIARFDATDLMCEFARKCALSVVHLWNCPPIVKQYLETGDESIRAAAWDGAWDGAWDAARAAAWAAARDEARAAAWDAAWAAARASARASAWDAAWDEARAAKIAEFRDLFAQVAEDKFKEMEGENQ